MAIVTRVIHTSPTIIVSLLVDNADTIVVNGVIHERVVQVRTNRIGRASVNVAVGTLGADRVRRVHAEDRRGGAGRGTVTTALPAGVYTNGLEVALLRSS